MKLLLVDDDPSCRFLLASFLEDQGHEVRQAETLAEARSELGGFSPDLTFLDCQLPDGSGLSLVGELRSSCPSGRIILLTGNRREDVSGDVDAVDGFLTKPFSLAGLADFMEGLGS